jgi:hypothetical protein
MPRRETLSKTLLMLCLRRGLPSQQLYFLIQKSKKPKLTKIM